MAPPRKKYYEVHLSVKEVDRTAGIKMNKTLEEGHEMVTEIKAKNKPVKVVKVVMDDPDASLNAQLLPRLSKIAEDLSTQQVHSSNEDESEEEGPKVKTGRKVQLGSVSTKTMKEEPGSSKSSKPKKAVKELPKEKAVTHDYALRSRTNAKLLPGLTYDGRAY